VTEKSIGLVDLYASALEDFLARRDEAGLKRAYELGRLGLVNGIGILDLASVHHEALADVVQRAETPDSAAETVCGVADFFVESLSPYEMTHRGFRESAIALRHLYEGLEAELKRIAHIVHDDAGQLLASVYLAMAELEPAVAPDSRRQFEKVMELLGHVERHLRRLPHELRPTALDDLGLPQALQFLAEGMSLRGVKVSVDCTRYAAVAPGHNGDHRGPGEPSTNASVPMIIETAIYRIVQEALTNITRHARASQATVRVWQENQKLCCSIRDNGAGFDVPATLAKRSTERGLGLRGIQERIAALGGTLQIESRPGEGTRLDFVIPAEASHVTRYPPGR
jgi:signal transduction histidine kinase